MIYALEATKHEVPEGTKFLLGERPHLFDPVLTGAISEAVEAVKLSDTEAKFLIIGSIQGAVRMIAALLEHYDNPPIMSFDPARKVYRELRLYP